MQSYRCLRWLARLGNKLTPVLKHWIAQLYNKLLTQYVHEYHLFTYIYLTCPQGWQLAELVCTRDTGGRGEPASICTENTLIL